MRHELKTDSKPFDAVWKGTKLYEIRKDDKTDIGADGLSVTATPYNVDGELLLRETEFSDEQMKGGRHLAYTGREVLCVVTHKLPADSDHGSYGISPGWCILGIRRVELIDKKGPHDGSHYTPEQPEEFVNKATQHEVSTPGTLVGEAVKTRDPMPSRQPGWSRGDPPAHWVARFGLSHATDRMHSTHPLFCMGKECFSDGTTPHSAECIAEYEATTSGNKHDAPRADLVKHIFYMGGDGKPYCPQHGPKVVHNDCACCKVCLDARCMRLQDDQRKADVPVAVERRAFSHYFRPTPYHGVDVYRILSIFEVVHPAIQHAIKKLLVAGKRGAKDTCKDWSEAVVSINRAIEMMDEDKAGDAVQ